MKVVPRTPGQLNLMRQSGEITAKALKKALEASKEGVSLIEVDKIAEAEIIRLGGEPSFMSVPGYKWTTCLTINNEVVHGIPREITLKKGDVFSIDIGAIFNGWHTDAAWSLVVEGRGERPFEALRSPQALEEVKGKDFEEKKKFLKAGEEALWNGVEQAVAGKRIGDISNAIQTRIEGIGGYKVVRSLVGHGIGRSLHEDPEVPGFGTRGKGMPLKKDMTIAIESIYTESTTDVMLDNDGWTISSKDGSLGGLFEMTVIIGDNKAEVLTDWRKV